LLYRHAERTVEELYDLIVEEGATPTLPQVVAYSSRGRVF
jgi:hypothetical protein